MKKVLLGMSGGVDSSVAAILLKEAGWSVVGVTADLLPCSDRAVLENAKRTADFLGLEHHVLDFKDIFKEKVIDDFICKYSIGKTPSPCIECNRHIKFGALLDFAEKNGISHIATGHYAKSVFDDKSERFLLKCADCAEKDQSYMLYTLNQHQLSKVIFPLQNLTKEEVRKIAEKHNLPSAKSKDSQEICFIKDDDYIRFLSENMEKPMPKGEFVDTNEKLLGTHDGIHRYTIGQRKGLGIAFGKPMFVVRIDAKKNQVVLGEAGSEFSDSLIAKKVNFIPFDKLEAPIEAMCKVRYGNKLYKGTIYPMENGNVKVEFMEKARAVTPGQSVVFYDGDMVLGGGIIV